MSYTTPITHVDQTPPHRCYVLFYYQGERQRIYNAKLLGQSCNPNRQKSMGDKRRELARLCKLVTDALANGWNPTEILIQEPKTKEGYLVEGLLTVKSRLIINGWSRTYVRDLTRVTDELLVFVKTNYPRLKPSALTPKMLAKFLDQYRSSGRYYMNKRRSLSSVFSVMGLDKGLVSATPKMKVVEGLNEAYSTDQLIPILQMIKEQYPKLYLCILLMYGTLLRPHEEIRLLNRKSFDKDLSHVLLPGKRTKNGKNRRVPIPEYVQMELIRQGVDGLSPNHNIFSRSEIPYNPDYFKRPWTLVKADLLKTGLIQQNQTLYSFRHTAASAVYKKTFNLKLLQGLMDHGTPDVTMKYIRSIGLINVGSIEDLPDLPSL